MINIESISVKFSRNREFSRIRVVSGELPEGVKHSLERARNIGVGQRIGSLSLPEPKEALDRAEQSG